MHIGLIAAGASCLGVGVILLIVLCIMRCKATPQQQARITPAYAGAAMMGMGMGGMGMPGTPGYYGSPYMNMQQMQQFQPMMTPNMMMMANNLAQRTTLPSLPPSAYQGMNAMGMNGMGMNGMGMAGMGMNGMGGFGQQGFYNNQQGFGQQATPGMQGHMQSAQPTPGYQQGSAQPTPSTAATAGR